MDIVEELIEETRNYKIEDLAKKTGLCRSTIAGWRNGMQPTLANAQKVANAMGMEFLLFPQENPTDICKKKGKQNGTH